MGGWRRGLGDAAEDVGAVHVVQVDVAAQIAPGGIPRGVGRMRWGSGAFCEVGAAAARQRVSYCDFGYR